MLVALLNLADTSETEYRIAIALDVPGAEDNEDEEVQRISAIVIRVIDLVLRQNSNNRP